MLADVGGHEGVASGHFPQFLDHELRLDDLVGAGVLQALLAAPGLDLLPPLLDRRRLGVGARQVVLGAQIGQYVLDVADDGHVDAHALGDRRGIDVDVDDLARVLREMARIADDAVIEARPDGQQHVAVLHRHVRLVGAVHAGHAQEAVVGGRHRAQAHQGVGARRAGLVHQVAQGLGGIGQDHAAARVDHGTLGVQQHLHGLLDLALVPLVHRRVRAHRDLALGRRVLALRDGDVLRDIDQHGAGTAGAGDEEGTAHGLGQVLDVAHQEVVLDAGTRDAHGVAFLEGILADGRSRHLAADDDHGDGVHVGGGDAGDGIGDARTAGHQAYAHFLRGARVRVGGVHGSLLVTHQNVLEFVLLENRVVDVKHRAARVAENVFHAFFGQAAHDDVGAIEFHVVFPFSTGLARLSAARPDTTAAEPEPATTT
ncbi:hypothetical protein L573_2108 [Bordetella holmesii H620]|nr:hypothetical protein L573_2108 [Bordetella holmesii H620]